MEQGTFDLGDEPAPAKLCECGCGQPAPIAKRNDRSRNHVKGQPKRFIQGHAGSLNGVLFVEVGQRFGRGVVIDADIRLPHPASPRHKSGARAARLVCDCGNEYVSGISPLLQGHVRSCGLREPKWRGAPNRAARNAALGSYRRSARKRGIAWELADEDFDRLTSRECHYCGSPPSAVWKAAVKYGNGDFIYTGIDRKDSTLGYTLDNVVPCCKTCNYAKRSMSYDDFTIWIARLIAYHWFNPEMTPSRHLKAVM